jgi:hypothetical protein
MLNAPPFNIQNSAFKIILCAWPSSVAFVVKSFLPDLPVVLPLVPWSLGGKYSRWSPE